MTRDQVIEELRYLATVEHALCIEYLYAHYSLNAPMKLDNLPGVKPVTRRIYAAAYEVFIIAIDKMRHLRWVNKTLDLLGQPPSLGRATIIGRALKEPYQLKPLTAQQLAWFIKVEEPSQAINEPRVVDSMYVRLHTSIDKQPEKFFERNRLMYLIKLIIIDEGGDHYKQFLSIRDHLAGIPESDYLRPLATPTPGSDLKKIQELSDKNYEIVLDHLQVSLSLGDKAAGLSLEQSRRAIFNLHEVNHLLASKGIGPESTLPVTREFRLEAAEVLSRMEELKASFDSLAESVKELEETDRLLATRQQQTNSELFELTRRLIKENM